MAAPSQLPQIPLPPADTAHIWVIDLATTPALADWLDVHETERAARLHFECDRRRFVACRSTLRRLLGAYLNRDPAALTFHTNGHGRPSLAGGFPLEFNVSHSADLALIAIAARGPLGVDVEILRDVPRALELAKRWLHYNERLAVEAAPAAERSQTFLDCWTRKEAVLKSLGTGLALDPRTIESGARRTDSQLKIAQPGGEMTLRVASRVPADGYIAACATAPGVRKLALRRFDPQTIR